MTDFRDSGGCTHHHVCLPLLIKVGRSGWGTCLVQKQFNSISETNKHLAATKRGLHHSFAHTSLVATGNRRTLESSICLTLWCANSTHESGSTFPLTSAKASAGVWEGFLQ